MGASVNPRRMCLNESCASGALTYNLYTDANHRTILVGTNGHGGGHIRDIFEIWAGSGPLTKTFPVYAKLDPLQTNIKPGHYAANFDGRSTAIAFYNTSANTPTTCSQSTFSNNERFAFSVTATATKKCNITAPQNIDFGTVGSLATNLQGQTSLGITCTRDTPYKIGLMPSNRNVNGAGEMAAKKAGNTDRVPYQLRSQAGMNGKIWGNTATSQAVGNGVGGTGTGMQQKHNIYATVDSADYRAGDYQDKVIINVHY